MNLGQIANINPEVELAWRKLLGGSPAGYFPEHLVRLVQICRGFGILCQWPKHHGWAERYQVESWPLLPHELPGFPFCECLGSSVSLARRRVW